MGVMGAMRQAYLGAGKFLFFEWQRTGGSRSRNSAHREVAVLIASIAPITSIGPLRDERPEPFDLPRSLGEVVGLVVQRLGVVLGRIAMYRAGPLAKASLLVAEPLDDVERQPPALLSWSRAASSSCSATALLVAWSTPTPRRWRVRTSTRLDGAAIGMGVFASGGTAVT